MAQSTPLVRVRDAFPYPIARSYAMVFDPDETARQRRWNLWFTVYQLLRTTCLPLVCQYLRDSAGEPASGSGYALNAAVAGISSPRFADWIRLLHALRKHLPRVGIGTVFPRLGEALDAIAETVNVPFNVRGDPRPARLGPLEAIEGLRNAIAHGVLDDEATAARHLETYLPILQSVVGAFDFLADITLVVRDPGGDAAQESWRARALRGSDPHAGPVVEAAGPLRDVLSASSTALVAADGRTLPLFPLFHTPARDEPVYLYDGCSTGLREGGTGKTGYIKYTGVAGERTDEAPYVALAELLAARRVSLLLRKERTAPWTIADSAFDYSQRTLNDLTGVKYFPQCYEPLPALDRAVGDFLRIPDKISWPADPTAPRYTNGLLLTGRAGAGKTAFLAHEVGRLLTPPNGASVDGTPDLVLFLRGGDLLAGASLFEGVAEKLGVAVQDAPETGHRTGGFSSFRELLDLLHRRWREDRVADRRLLLALDALEEAPDPERVLRQALELIRNAASYPWIKIIASVRREWLDVWASRLSETERNPLDEVQKWLYVPRADRDHQDDLPVVAIEPLTTRQAGEIYARYQRAAETQTDAGRYQIPACLTPWDELPADAARLFTTPLHLHLFMEAFDQAPAAAMRTVPELFRRRVDRSLAGRSTLQAAASMVVDRLLADPSRVTATLADEDVNALRRRWAEGLTPEEIRQRLSPVQALEVEGLLVKQHQREGGGHRFVFQQVGEYLLYRQLSAERGPDEDELAYWRRRAAVARPFAEYRGAFGFLFRDWADRGVNEQIGSLADAAPFLEGAPHWLLGILTAFLVEQAHADMSPDREPRRAEAIAKSLRRSGKVICGAALLEAARELGGTRVGLGAALYAAAAFSLLQVHPALRLLAAQAALIGSQEMIALGQAAGAEPGLRTAIQLVERAGGSADSLAAALMNVLGRVLERTGRPAEAEDLFTRSVQIYEQVLRRDPADTEAQIGYETAVGNLALRLHERGLAAEARRLVEPMVETLRNRHSTNPHDTRATARLAEALNIQGYIEMASDRLEPAERVLREAVALAEGARAGDPEDLVVGDALCAALHNLGSVLIGRDDLAAAESVLRRSAAVAGALWKHNPAHVDIGDSLAAAGIRLGDVLGRAGRFGEAVEAYRTASAAAEQVYQAGASADKAGGLVVHALCGLGDALDRSGQVDAAERAWQRCIAFGNHLWERNRGDTVLADYLGQALYRLGLLVHHHRNQREAAGAFLRQAVGVFTAAYGAGRNPMVRMRLARALDALGDLLLEDGRRGEAAAAYSRSAAISQNAWQEGDVEGGTHLADMMEKLSHVYAAPPAALQAAQECVRVRERLYDQPQAPQRGSDRDRVLELGQALNRLAVLLAHVNRPRDAERTFRRALEVLTPEWTPVPDRIRIGRELFFTTATLRALLLRQGRAAEARHLEPPLLQVSAALVALLPDDADLASGLAYLLADVGRIAEAQYLADRILARWPGDRGAEEVKRRIEQQRKAR